MPTLRKRRASKFADVFANTNAVVAERTPEITDSAHALQAVFSVLGFSVVTSCLVALMYIVCGHFR